MIELSSALPATIDGPALPPLNGEDRRIEAQTPSRTGRAVTRHAMLGEQGLDLTQIIDGRGGRRRKAQ